MKEDYNILYKKSCKTLILERSNHVFKNVYTVA